jgi:hypothetical protein
VLLAIRELREACLLLVGSPVSFVADARAYRSRRPSATALVQPSKLASYDPRYLASRILCVPSLESPAAMIRASG